MKTNLLIAVLALLLLAPTGVMAKEANTIDELVAMFDDSKCMGCHPDITKDWKESYHSKSVTSSLYGMRNFYAIGVPMEWERKLTKVEVLKCLDCHVPEVNYASEKLAVEIAEMIIQAKDAKNDKEKEKLTKELSKLRVGCISCHNLKATTIAIGLLGEPVEGAVYGVHGKESPAHLTIQSNAMKAALFCAQCHGQYIAPDGEQIMCNTLSGSYYNAYISEGGSETCQDCHMHKKDRGHKLPGGHDLDIVKEGIGLRSDIVGVRYTVGTWIPRAIINVALKNKSGHRTPDG
jgi:Zn-finger protein